MIDPADIAGLEAAVNEFKVSSVTLLSFLQLEREYVSQIYSDLSGRYLCSSLSPRQTHSLDVSTLS